MSKKKPVHMKTGAELIDELYNFTRHNIQSFSDDFFKGLSNNDKLLHYDYTEDRFKRRKKATLKYLDKAKQVLGERFGSSQVECEFIKANGLMMCGGYDYIDRHHFLTLAAAIWMLDQLSLQGDLDNVYQYLHEYIETDDENIDDEEFFVPPVNYPSHSYDVLYAMVMLILRRNDGLSETDISNSSLTDQWTVSSQRIPTNGHVKRKEFDAVMALLDNKAKEIAAKKFEEKVWEFYELSFSVISYVRNKIDQYHNEADEIESKIEDLLNQTRNQYSIQPGAPYATQNHQQLKEMMGSLLITDQQTSHKTKIPENSTQKELKKLRVLLQNIEGKIKKLDNSPYYSTISLVNDREKTVKSLADLLPQELSDRLSQFSVDDPFEMAFAILYLLDQGSDIPWLYYGSISVAYTTEDQLPINRRVFDEGEEHLSNEINRRLYHHQYPRQGWNDDTDSDGLPVHRMYGKNLGQIIYSSTFSILPRTTYNIADIENVLKELELSSQKEEIAYELLFNLLISSFHGSQSHLSRIHEDNEANEETEDENSVPVDESEEVQVLKEETKKLRDEIRRLRKSFHEEASRYQKTIEKRKAMENIAENYRRENVDLRDLVFKLNTKQPENEEVDSRICFPYYARQRIIAFGGHPSWLKSMRGFLPSVRFFEPDALPTTDIIRNADVIWIQTNCLSHSFFYKIINTARNDNKRIRYFVYSSAEKCAEQIGESEVDLC